MRTVLLAAASTLCLAFAAHSAPAGHRGTRHTISVPLPLSSTTAEGQSCIGTGAALSHAAYIADDGADRSDGRPYCSQYLSTQSLVRPPLVGHT